MEVTSELVAKVPRENLRVRRDEFAAVWAVVEGWGSQPAATDDYLLGVLQTCEWLADQPVREPGRFEIPLSPITVLHRRAMPEAIEEEYFAALRSAHRRGRPDFVRGVIATLDWTWNGSRQPPLDISQAGAS